MLPRPFTRRRLSAWQWLPLTTMRRDWFMARRIRIVILTGLGMDGDLGIITAGTTIGVKKIRTLRQTLEGG